MFILRVNTTFGLVVGASFRNSLTFDHFKNLLPLAGGSNMAVFGFMASKR